MGCGAIHSLHRHARAPSIEFTSRPSSPPASPHLMIIITRSIPSRNRSIDYYTHASERWINRLNWGRVVVEALPSIKIDQSINQSVAGGTDRIPRVEGMCVRVAGRKGASGRGGRSKQAEQTASRALGCMALEEGGLWNRNTQSDGFDWVDWQAVLGWAWLA